MNILDKVAIPTTQSIGPCNANRCNAVVAARMNHQDYLTVVGIREDERGTIVTVGSKVNNTYAESDFKLEDLELYA